MIRACSAGAVDRGRAVWVLTHRHELVNQAAARLRAAGLKVGVIVGGAASTDYTAPVQVVSIPTIANRILESAAAGIVAPGLARSFHPSVLPPPPALAFFDEAHHIVADTWRRVLHYCKDSWVIFLSATPQDKHGGGLGVADVFVDGPAPRTLVGPGLPLVDVDLFAGPAPDLSDIAVSTKTGDYQVKELAEKASALVGDVVTTWQRLAPGKRTIAFAVNRAHSRVIVEAFLAAGVPAEHVDANSTDEQRAAVFARLARGETLVVSNVGLVTEGFDCPAVECVILAKPSKSEVFFLQSVGRALRASKGKDRAIVLDHGYNCARHGHPLMFRPCTLEGRPPRPEVEDAELVEGGDYFVVCPKCLCCCDLKALVCTHCGEDLRAVRPIRFDTSVQLERFDATSDPVEQKRRERRAAWYAMENRAMKVRRPSPWGIAYAYRDRYGVLPVDDTIFRTKDERERYWSTRRKGAGWHSAMALKSSASSSAS